MNSDEASQRTGRRAVEAGGQTSALGDSRSREVRRRIEYLRALFAKRSGKIVHQGPTAIARARPKTERELGSSVERRVPYRFD